MHSKKWCFGGRHYSTTSDIFEYEETNPKTNEIVQVRNLNCDVSGRSNSKISTKSMVNKQTKTKLTKGEKLQKFAKCKNNVSSPMSELSWCDFYNNGNQLRTQDVCPNPRCKCQKQITFTPNQFQLEGAGYKNTKQKVLKGIQKAWIFFLSDQ